MDVSALLPIAIGVTLIGGGALAGFLLSRAAKAPGARPLAAFCALVGVWSVGLLLPNRRGDLLLASAPLGAAVFAHFAAAISQVGKPPLLAIYTVGVAACLAAAVLGAGHFPAVPSGAFIYDGAGLGVVAVTIALALWGQSALARAWFSASGVRRSQLALVALSSALGLISVSGLAPPLVGEPPAPWTLLALPVYLIGLVYAVLRYELMDVNVWARRAVAAALLVGLGALASIVSTGWLATQVGASFAWTAGALLLGLALAAPLRLLADRIVFPGGEMTAGELSSWRAAMAEAADEYELNSIAESLLRTRFGASARFAELAQTPPGPRRIMATLADIRTQAANDIARRKAQAERKRLAELGMLAATVAHDLRNPMNIIAMAAAEAPSEARADIRTQLTRMNALVRDLLDYAKPWRLEREAVDVAAAILNASAPASVETVVPEGLEMTADPHRLAQALGNLLDNARVAGGKVCVQAEQGDGAVLIHVCDDGPGVPAEIRDTLFQPFASRGPDGTGLGLAIVAKIMAAHGGEAKLGEKPGWSTCFTLRFPQ